MSRQGTVFELIDQSEERFYYPVGVFLTLGDALQAVEKEAEPWTLSEYWLETNFVVLVIYRRPLGFSQYGKVVWSRTWENQYCAEIDERKWVEVNTARG